jgi:hypothetical protein
LIPYFRDANGTNIFIETTINRDTDKTGLFCSFNSDLVETDYYNGMLDLIGQTTAGILESEIEFLSYKETISESVEIVSTPLDLPGNVTALLGNTGYINQANHAFGSPMQSGIVQYGDSRTAWFAEGSTYDVTLDSIVSTTSDITVTYLAPDGFAVIGDSYATVSGTFSFTLNASDYTATYGTLSYVSTFVLDNTGTISVKSNTTGSSANVNTTNPSVGTSDIVLGYVNFQIFNGDIATSSVALTPVNVDSNGFVDYQFGVDYDISLVSTGSIKVEFLDTNAAPNVKNYEQYRKIKLFNKFVDLLHGANKDKMSLCLGGPTNNYDKVSLSGMTITNIVTSTTTNKSFILNTGLNNSKLSDIINGDLVIYTVDNELILGTDSMTTKSETSTTADGVVGKYSKFYTKYYDGLVNTGDYFYTNRIPQSMILNGEKYEVTFTNGENAGSTSSYAGKNYVIFEGALDPAFDVYEQFIVPSSTKNTGSFTINSNLNPATVALAFGITGWGYEISENVTDESVYNVSEMYDYINKKYIKMYLDSSNVLYTTFWDDLLFTGNTTLDVISNNTFYIQSEKSNFTQTVEIEVPSGYVQVPNKILVKANRYTEVKAGDFLLAYYDEAALQIGEAPRKLTRILSKKAYAGDSTLAEITCDSRIATSSYNGDLQTTRYASIDNYATTYKGIAMKGFRVRLASLPDGTETRQNSILNIAAKGTPLFKAITNKEAIDFRYLIDSFGLGLTERSKQQLVDICGERLDALGVINMPSMKSFKNSSSPSFVNAEGVLQLEYVAKGGDPESSPAFLYSFGDGLGSTSVGYFMPYVTVNDNGRPVNVPPAAWVATTYMRKHISNISGITPWTIAAGVTNGRITNISATEMDFTATDIEYINQAQMNPIVFKRNRGNVIETENTAQTLYKSALSYLHVREVLIELERELSRMLLDFQWKFNTPDIRSEIKLRADVICETYVSKNGLYNYFNKMDEENNTSEIIDNQIGVLDTYVEPIKGMGIIVNNITILRTGAISAGGFING